jgi:RNA polymerase sigma factor (sigma-70 family)
MDSAARLTPDALLAHEAFVLRLARSLVRDEATAHDLAQETWLSALERPPREGSLRAWLATVTRNHARNLARGRGRREARERATARGEAAESEPSSSERLELQHGVVRAVLELDEPYRSVVIGVYYDGASPSELARARGVPAGTLRAQLSRGLEMLRARLDGEHGGDRRAWSAALLGFLRREDAAAAGAGVGAIAGWMAAAALVVASVVAWRMVDVRQPSVAAPVVAAAPTGAPDENSDLQGATDGARGAVAPAPAAAAAAQAPQPAADPAAELRDLAERALWLKDRILARRTAIEPSVARAWAWVEGRADVGLVRLLDTQLSGERFELPWLAGGATTWSLTERTHDAARHGQLKLDQQGLGTTSNGGGKGVVVDLGEADLRGFVSDLDGAIQGLDADVRAAWEVATRTLDVRPGMQKLELQKALRELKRDDEVEPEEGHVYLVRCFRPAAYDVLALVEVARVERFSTTLAWWVIESRPVAGELPAPASREAERAALSARPEYEALDEPALLAELERVEARTRELLAAAQATPAEAARGVRHATLIDRNSPLARSHEPEAEPWLYSFATARHGKRSEQDVHLEDGAYRMDFNVRSISWFLDLGAIELADAERVAAESFGPGWNLMSTAKLPHFVPQAERVEVQMELERKGLEVGLRDRVEGRVGHTYLVRSIYPSWHDQLVAFRLEQRGEAGDRLAWRVLATWLVQER